MSEGQLPAGGFYTPGGFAFVFGLLPLLLVRRDINRLSQLEA